MAQENTVVSLRDFRAQSELNTEQELAAQFDVAQSTMHRWLKREDIFVEMNGTRWVSVFCEKVLKERKVRASRK